MARNKIYKTIFAFVCAIVLLYFSFRNIEWSQFVHALKSCDWAYVLLSMLIAVLAFYLRAMRWHSLLGVLSSGVSLKDSFNAINISLICNLVVPRAGEFVRCSYIVKHSAADAQGNKYASYEKVLGIAIVDRSLDIISLLLLSALVLLLKWQACVRFISLIYDKYLKDIALTNKLYVFVLAGFCLLLFVSLILFLKKRLSFVSKIYDMMYDVYRGVVLSVKDKKSRLAFLYSVLVWFLYVLTAYAIVLAIRGIDPAVFPESMYPAIAHLSCLSFVDTMLLVFVGSLSSFVPVPGGFGAFHILVSLALSFLYGIPEELGLVFATLTHESQVIIQVIAGMISYIYEYFS